MHTHDEHMTRTVMYCDDIILCRQQGFSPDGDQEPRWLHSEQKAHFRFDSADLNPLL